MSRAGTSVGTPRGHEIPARAVAARLDELRLRVGTWSHGGAPGGVAPPREARTRPGRLLRVDVARRDVGETTPPAPDRAPVKAAAARRSTAAITPASSSAFRQAACGAPEQATTGQLDSRRVRRRHVRGAFQRSSGSLDRGESWRDVLRLCELVSPPPRESPAVPRLRKTSGGHCSQSPPPRDAYRRHPAHPHLTPACRSDPMARVSSFLSLCLLLMAMLAGTAHGQARTVPQPPMLSWSSLRNCRDTGTEVWRHAGWMRPAAASRCAFPKNAAAAGSFAHAQPCARPCRINCDNHSLLTCVPSHPGLYAAIDASPTATATGEPGAPKH